MAVSKRLRYEVLRRDNHACRYCGATAPGAKLTVDHVTPTALGGTDTPDNLVTACSDCNGGKTSTAADSAIVADVAQDALRWAAAMKQAAAELEAQQQPKKEYRAAFKQAWDEWTYPAAGGRKTFDLDPEWRISLERFRQAGLPAAVWPDIVERAMTNKTVKSESLFRYCCGIAWRMVTELQDRAKAVIAAETAPDSEEEDDPQQAALLAIWVNERDGDITNEQGRAFEASIARVLDGDADFPRLAEAAKYAAWLGLDDIEAGLASMDRDQLYQTWLSCWYAAAGEFPDDTASARVTEQIDALLSAQSYRGRVELAAAYAGAHRSTRLYFALGEDDLAATGENRDFARFLESWAVSCRATTGRWPTPDEGAPLWQAVQDIPEECTWGDLNRAAAASAMYQSTDLRPCLAPSGDVFAAAALIPNPGGGSQ